MRPDASALNGARVHVPCGPAIADPATVAALRAYRKRALLLLACALAVVAGAGFLINAEARSAARLLRVGVRTEGIVVATWGDSRNGNSATVDYLVRGVSRRASIHYGDAQHYFRGEPVEVIYDPRDPSRVRTPLDANDDGVGKNIYLYVLLAAIAMALGAAGAAARPWRWRRLLREPWRPYVCTYIPGRQRRAAPGVRLVPLDDPRAEPIAMRLGAVMRQRSARLGGERVVWVAGDPAGRAVLALPLTRELYPASAPRGWTGRQWVAAQRPVTGRELRAWRIYFGIIAVVAEVAGIAAIKGGHWILGALLLGKGAFLAYLFIRTTRHGGSGSGQTPATTPGGGSALPPLG